MDRYIAEKFLASNEFEGFKQMAFFYALSKVSKKVNGCYSYKRTVAEDIYSEAICRFVEYIFSEREVTSTEGLIRKIIINLIKDRGRHSSKMHRLIAANNDSIVSAGRSLEDYAPATLLIMECELDDLLKDARLTPREVKVIRLINRGHSQKAIAERLGVTPAYINQIIQSARRKIRPL